MSETTGPGQPLASGPARWRWTAYDAQILRLAAPALGALAAGPLYVLVDTAIVGHLGVAPLAALALAGTLLDGVLALTNFLAYAMTPQVGRAHAAGQADVVRSLAAQSLWVAGALGLALAGLGVVGGRFALSLLGATGEVLDLASIYLLIAVLGLPFGLIAQAGEGFTRGMADLRTPFLVIVAANILNVVLEIWFVYGLGWGLAGSAWVTFIAEGLVGGFFAYRLWSASSTGPKGRAQSQAPAGPLPAGAARLKAMRPLLRMSLDILIRTASLYSTFVVFSAVLARIGAASLAAHQVIFQLWLFMALVLDAIAIAGQVIVSRSLGAGDAEGAVTAARRMIAWSVLVGALCTLVFLVLGGLLPRLFTEDESVLQQVAAAWPIFALMQPVSAAVFALDGILIGAGDSRYLARAMAACAACAIPVALLALVNGWGLVGVWLALLALISVRLLTTGWRFASGRWVVTGAQRAG